MRALPRSRTCRRVRHLRHFPTMSGPNLTRPTTAVANFSNESRIVIFDIFGAEAETLSTGEKLQALSGGRPDYFFNIAVSGHLGAGAPLIFSARHHYN